MDNQGPRSGWAGRQLTADLWKPVGVALDPNDTGGVELDRTVWNRLYVLAEGQERLFKCMLRPDLDGLSAPTQRDRHPANSRWRRVVAVHIELESLVRHDQVAFSVRVDSGWRREDGVDHELDFFVG